MTEPDVIDAEATEIDEHDLPVANPPSSASTALVARDEISVVELLKQSAVIEEAMRRAMTVDVHYGKIPGVSKPTLLKPGAEKLNVLFRLAPSYLSEKHWHEDGHLTVVAKCILTHIPTGYVVGEGEGLCTTRESKYAYRQGGRVCPECSSSAIIKGKAEYGGGWVCFKKKGGCGEKFADDTPEGQAFQTADVGRVPNEDLADSFNTVLKMADKRALVAAVLNSTAASDVFTQDVEDNAPAGGSTSRPAETGPQPPQDWKQIGAFLEATDPNLDWKQLTAQAVAHVYAGVDDWRKLPAAEQRDVGKRMALMCSQLPDPASFPPASTEDIVRAFAAAFDGAVVEVPEGEAALSAEQQAQLDEAAAAAADLDG